MNRLEAFRTWRVGCTITKEIVGMESSYGRLHTYIIYLKRDRMMIKDLMMREGYIIKNYTPKQVVSFIRRHFPVRDVRVQKDPIKRVA